MSLFRERDGGVKESIGTDDSLEKLKHPQRPAVRRKPQSSVDNDRKFEDFFTLQRLWGAIVALSAAKFVSNNNGNNNNNNNNNNKLTKWELRVGWVIIMSMMKIEQEHE